MKKRMRLMPILMAIMMVFTMMPALGETVYAGNSARGAGQGVYLALKYEGSGYVLASEYIGTAGTTVEIMARPSDGYRFKNWEIVSGTGSIGAENNNLTTFTMGTTDATVKAVFEILPAGGNSLACFVNSGGTASATADPNDSAVYTLQATPASGYKFVSWEIKQGNGSIDNKAAASTTIRNCSGSVVVMASFSTITYPITTNANPGEGGSAASSSGEGDTTPGGDGQTASSAGGNTSAGNNTSSEEISNGSEEGDNASGTGSTANTSNTPAAITHTVTFNANGHGSAPAAITVNEGNTISEPATPSEDGFSFTGWFLDKETTDKWDFDKDTVSDSITLYAGWQEDTKTPLRGEAGTKNGGTSISDNISLSYRTNNQGRLDFTLLSGYTNAPEETITITNNNSEAVEITGFGYADSFVINPNAPQTISANGSITLTIKPVDHVPNSLCTVYIYFRDSQGNTGEKHVQVAVSVRSSFIDFINFGGQLDFGILSESELAAWSGQKFITIYNEWVEDVTVTWNEAGSSKFGGSGYTGEHTIERSKMWTILLTPDKSLNAGTHDETVTFTVKDKNGNTGMKTMTIMLGVGSSYSVTVTNDGHGSGTADPAFGAKNKQVTLTASPDTGYKFKEWQVISGGVTVTNDKFTIGTSDVEIKAFFDPISYNISYELNGGTNATTNPATYTIANTPLTLAPLTGGPTGHTFDGWYDNAAFSGNVITEIPANSTGDKTFYAKWTADTYNISYQNLKGASNSNPVTYTITDTPIPLVSPTGATGYTFDGWYDNAAFSGNAITAIPANSTGDKTFYAKWTAVKYDVSYQNLNGASNSNPATYTIADTPLTLAPLTGGPTGHTFDGWYDNAAFSGNAIKEIPAGSSGDKQFFAKWTETPHQHDWKPATCTEPKTCKTCGATEGKALGHKWDAGKVTKAATEKAEGVKTYTCTVCKATKTEKIPKLKPSAPKVSGTPTAKMTAKGNNSLTIAWNKIQNVDGYDIFFAQCNHSGKKIACKKVKTIKGNKTFTWTKSGLKKGTAYKAYVKAYVMKNGKKSYVRTTPMMHAYTGGQTKNYTNAKSVTVKKANVTLKKGKTFKIKATVNKVNKKKKLMSKSHVATLRYTTSNSKVATVNSSGKITAKGKGICYIYVYAHNGVSKQVKVTVK